MARVAINSVTPKKNVRDFFDSLVNIFSFAASWPMASFGKTSVLVK